MVRAEVLLFVVSCRRWLVNAIDPALFPQHVIFSAITKTELRYISSELSYILVPWLFLARVLMSFKFAILFTAHVFLIIEVDKFKWYIKI